MKKYDYLIVHTHIQKYLHKRNKRKNVYKYGAHII